MTPKKILLTAGWIEAASTLLLFFGAMPLKYIGGNEIGVKIMGPVHDGLFVIFVALVFILKSTIPLNGSLVIRCLIGAVIPFGPFLYHKDLEKMGDDAASAEEEN